MLNGNLHFGFTISLKNGQKEKKKKKMTPFWAKKTEEKQNSTTIMISVNRNGTVFPGKLKLQG